MSEATKWKLMVVLVAAWVLLLAVRMTDDREPQRVPLTYVAGQIAKADQTKKGPTLVSFLSADPERVSAPETPSQNIFAPLEFPRPKPKPKPVAKPMAAPPPPPPPKPAVPPPPSPAELAAAQARKQLAQYRVIGYSDGGGEPRAFLGKGDKIFIATIGEQLEDYIEVAAITNTAVTLRETRTRLEAQLRIAGPAEEPRASLAH